LAKVAAESAPRKATMKSRNEESGRADRLAKKRQREQRKEQELEEERALLSDPKRPLNEREQRNLVRALHRYGSMADREDEIVQDAKLGDRDRDLLRSFLDDFIKACQQAVDDNKTKIAEDEVKTGKSLTKKDKKAVLFDFGELKKVNAETPLERPPQLQLLRRNVKSHGDWRTFRVPEATKAAHYSCPWGAKEDGMLLVGIDRHGFGAWAQIRDDIELEFGDKFFLEEHRIEKKEERNKGGDKIKAPGAVHLTRRAEYLLSVIQSRYSTDPPAQKSAENHNRSNKKHVLVNGHRRSDVGSASPAPAMIRKGSQQRDRDRDNDSRSRSHGDERGTPRQDMKRKHAGHADDRPSKHRRQDDPRRSSHHGAESPRPEKRKHRDDADDRAGKHRRTEDPRRLDADHRSRTEDRRPAREPRPEDDQRAKALQRLDELRRMGDSREERDKDPDALLWYLLKPVRENFERILATTKEKVKSSKDRARVFAVELVVIGDFLNQKFETKGLDDGLKDRFW
jgi:chromodomain-helicase-DNA-binding protein 1